MPTPQGICQICQALLHDDGSGLTNNLENAIQLSVFVIFFRSHLMLTP